MDFRCMGIGDWGLEIGDWRLGIGDWRLNLQSPISGEMHQSIVERGIRMTLTTHLRTNKDSKPAGG
ncbi:MAG: hypothetical protein ABIG63_21570 [Chloroflexota bacterium]